MTPEELRDLSEDEFTALCRKVFTAREADEETLNLILVEIQRRLEVAE